MPSLLRVRSLARERVQCDQRRMILKARVGASCGRPSAWVMVLR